MKALVLGGTGATGRALVPLLLGDSRYSEVHLFVRRPIELSHPKLSIHLLDFECSADWAGSYPADIAFSCLGTTRNDAGSQEAQRRVDVDYLLQFAQMCLRSGVQTFALLSSTGAQSDSSLFYLRLKGQAEDGIKALGFERTLFFRPGMIDRGELVRLGEKWTMRLVRGLNKLGLLLDQRPITTQQLAQQMHRHTAEAKQGLRIVSQAELLQGLTPH